jgi:alkyldihydroxyacetonephosphate synthase
MRYPGSLSFSPASAQHGYTIGHFPQSFEYATVGGSAAARSSGQSSAGYGRFDELVMALKLATPAGSLSLGRAPKSAAGPDLRQLILGSEGALGVITELTVRVRPVPEHRVYEAWRLPSFLAGAGVIRRLVQDGPLPTVLRLSDEAETALNLTRPGELGQAGDGGCLALVGFEGSAEDVAMRREEAAAVLRDGGAGCARRRRDLGTRSLSRAIPPRRAARCRRAHRDARDRHFLVLAR